jgi:hypothetical protein
MPKYVFLCSFMFFFNYYAVIDVIYLLISYSSMNETAQTREITTNEDIRGQKRLLDRV